MCVVCVLCVLCVLPSLHCAVQSRRRPAAEDESSLCLGSVSPRPCRLMARGGGAPTTEVEGQMG